MNPAIGGEVFVAPFNSKLYVASSQSFVPKETVPVNEPAETGLKSIEKVVVPPAGTVVVPNVVFKENSAPVIVIGPVRIKLEVPVFSIVNVAVVVEPCPTVP